MEKIRITELPDRVARVTIGGRSTHCTGYEVAHDFGGQAKFTLYGGADIVVDETGGVEWVALPKTVDEAFSVIARAMSEGVLDNIGLAKGIAAKRAELKRREA